LYAINVVVKQPKHHENTNAMTTIFALKSAITNGCPKTNTAQTTTNGLVDAEIMVRGGLITLNDKSESHNNTTVSNVASHNKTPNQNTIENSMSTIWLNRTKKQTRQFTMQKET